MEAEDRLLNLYKECFGAAPLRVEALAGAGGDRRYYRFYGASGATCIGTAADREADARAFVALARTFRGAGINVPEVYAVSADGLYYLQQDLGPVSLFSLLGSDDWMPQAEATVKMLARMQAVPTFKWEGAVEYAPFGRRLAMRDLNYFKYEYLLPLKVPVDEERLDDDFERLAELLTAGGNGVGFMMRDCQSRNVMVSGGEPWLIDFQGGRRGPAVYDIVSFLWQAKARMPREMRMHLFGIWKRELMALMPVGEDALEASLPLFVLFRTLQVLGAYGFRGLIQRRAHFIESIPSALVNLRELLEDDSLWQDMPELRRVCGYIAEHSPMPAPHEGLRITVSSFSYKKGYPENLTGNGGGFMFDCRGMHNPGRYEEYKPLTGLDREVIDFLEERGEVQEFVANALRMVEPTVECYLRRGFSDLEIGFGCTGGRHRSVYCAEAVANALAKKYPAAEVVACHREQGIRKELKR